MNLKDIKAIVQLISESDLEEFEYESGDIKIRIKKASSLGSQKVDFESFTAHSADTKIIDQKEEKIPDSDHLPDNEYLSIRSPMIGTFYERPDPDKEPFVKIGDRIEPGKTVCIIEAMKLFNTIESEISGRIVKILVENLSAVEYNQPLFLVDPF